MQITLVWNTCKEKKVIADQVDRAGGSGVPFHIWLRLSRIL